MGVEPSYVDKKAPPNPTKGIFLKGSVIGAIITIPSLAAFFLSWYLLGDKITALIVGAIVHFVGMGFSIKLSKKLFKAKQPEI
ncbi:MAG TPA: hypothetical protein VNK44_02570 [Candidatus Nitrosotenuis sp.]|nr:hypothetical protein [Candidatus Nitrosotenuis sp.]